MKKAAAVRTVVLAGGGHTHALVLRGLQRCPLPPDVELIVVSPAKLTPYSGMLPGYLAGHYAFEDMHIDLERLCSHAGARLIEDCVTGLAPATRTLHLGAHPPLHYDLLSLNTGAMPAQQIPGVAEFALPVKPIAGFIARWHALRAQLRNAPVPQQVVIVGGGAGSVEVALALVHATGSDPSIAHKPRFTLVTRDAGLLAGYPPAVSASVEAHCRQQGVTVITGFDVAQVYAGCLHGTALAARPAARQFFDHLIWCTEAAAPRWLKYCGLALDARGFVRVGATLQSCSDPAVFAAGDLAHFDPGPLPKAGVYAVRQAPVLLANLHHALLGEALQNYQPQANFLSLLALGGKVATGTWGRLTVRGRWVWRWKDWIDRRFMAQFR